MPKRQRRVCVGLIAGALCFGNLLAANGSASPGCDRVRRALTPPITHWTFTSRPG
jgi:hypothetical protein